MNHSTSIFPATPLGAGTLLSRPSRERDPAPLPVVPLGAGTLLSLSPPPRSARACAAFTVIELLMVVGTLSVLLAIILPTIKTVRNSALNRKARAEATALAQAAIHYKNEYGFWPGQLQTKADDAVELRPAFKNLPADFVPAIISGPKSFTDSLQVTVEPVYLNENEVYQSFRQIGNKEGERFKSNPLNPKGIHFIDLAEENEPLRANFFDPWGRSYILFMGLNPHSTFTHTINFPNGGSQLVRVDNAIAFAFSYGQDGDRSTNYLYSAGVRK